MRDHEIQFGTLSPDGSMSNVRMIKQSDITKCPHIIMMQEHFRDDGTCRCDDISHTEMKEWGYEWNGEKWDA
jgi:hypothetical protein